MSSKVPKWIILFKIQSHSQSQTSNEKVGGEGVSKEAEVWIMETPKKGSRKRRGCSAIHVVHKKRYEGRFVRWHAHWHKEAEEVHQSRGVQTKSASQIKYEILVDTKVREYEKEIQVDKSQIKAEIKRVAAKCKELPVDNSRALEAENVIEIGEPELIMRSTYKRKSELLDGAEGLEVERVIGIDESELKTWVDTRVDIIKSTRKTRCKLSCDAIVPKAEQVTKATSGSTSDWSDGKGADDEVCEKNVSKLGATRVYALKSQW